MRGATQPNRTLTSQNDVPLTCIPGSTTLTQMHWESPYAHALPTPHLNFQLQDFFFFFCNFNKCEIVTLVSIITYITEGKILEKKKVVFTFYELKSSLKFCIKILKRAFNWCVEIFYTQEKFKLSS